MKEYAYEQTEPKTSARQFALVVLIESKHGSGEARRKNAEEKKAYSLSWE